MHRHILSILSLLTLFSFPATSATPRISIALQPFSGFDTAFIAPVKKDITSFYGSVDVIVLPSIPLPSMAFYAPRNRYRADKLLVYLDSLRGGSYTKIVGLTAKDISTTKGEYVDWGIFGLGLLGKGPCVVSTFRLKKDAPAAALLIRRLTQTVNHELGHTFGLDHCPHVGCIMEDAKGTIRTVDNSNGMLCDSCRKLLDIMIGSR